MACPGAVLVPLRDHEKDYGRYWDERWRLGQSFINVEQDVVPIAPVLEEMWNCPEPYCKTDYIYPWTGSHVDVSPIGCAKFSSEFIARHNTLIFNGTTWHEPQYIIINASLNKAHLHQPASLHLHVEASWPLDVRRLYGI